MVFSEFIYFQFIQLFLVVLNLARVKIAPSPLILVSFLPCGTIAHSNLRLVPILGINALQLDMVRCIVALPRVPVLTFTSNELRCLSTLASKSSHFKFEIFHFLVARVLRG